jgi:predicted RNA binding protein YcfA (HicA-like mRNA interferase family)
MTKLPADLTGQDLIKALKKAIQRQRGSHIIPRREFPHARLVVPDHKTIRFGTLRAILHDADLSVDRLLELL